MKRVRLHLSTALALMLATGVLLWVNMAVRVTPKFNNVIRINAWGWPFTARARYDGSSPVLIQGSEVGVLLLLRNQPDPDTFPERQWLAVKRWVKSAEADGWKWGGLAADIVVGLAVLIVIAMLCEWRISKAGKAR